MSTRVAFLTNIISPYRAPVFRHLAQTPGWSLRVFVNAASEFDRSWSVDLAGLDVVRSRSVSIPRRVVSREPIVFEQVITLHVPTGLWADLRRFRPDVIISHELGPRTLLAAAYARVHRIPLVIWSYQSRISATQGRRTRGFVRRRLLRQCRRAVGMGVQAREVLEAWGAPGSRIVDAPNATDHRALRERFETAESEARAAAIRDRVAGHRRIALVVGRLVPLKGTAAILDAWLRLPAETRERWRLVFVGEGPLDPLVRDARPLGVHLEGPVPVEEMADWYRAADLHVFPSMGDVWGLVVNEAMACGVPTLCSIHAGCCDDLVQDGVNGLSFDPTSGDGGSAALHAALDRHDLPALGEQARRDVAPYTTDRLAAAFRTAVEASLASSAADGEADRNLVAATDA
jgi:glycosyltransferase involved in cell wall biosynthesis